MWLLNKEWTIFPSISFDDDLTPCILSCRHHKKITRKYMVHTCRRPNHILPAAMPDQLCHVCIKPRTVHQMKRNFGSHGFQMYRQDGSFNGIDTCSCTSHGNFDFCSYISGEDEARTIVNRPDINSLLTTLAEKKVISTFTAECRRRDALDTTRGIDFSKYTRGATYVPLDICIHFHRESSIPRTIKTVNDTSDERNNKIVSSVIRQWPLYLYPCQSMNDYGAMPSKIPKSGKVVFETGLADLRDSCNKYLLPTVLCPYGCTEYLHKCESVPMDLVFPKYLSKVRLKICAESKKKIMSCTS